MPFLSNLGQKFDRLGEKIEKVFQPKNKYTPLSQDENAPEIKPHKDFATYFEAKSDQFATNVYPQLPPPEYSEVERIHDPSRIPPPHNGNMDPFLKFSLSVGAFAVFFAVFFIIQWIVQIIIGLFVLGGMAVIIYEWAEDRHKKKKLGRNKLQRSWRNLTNGIVAALDDR